MDSREPSADERGNRQPKPDGRQGPPCSCSGDCCKPGEQPGSGSCDSPGVGGAGGMWGRLGFRLVIFLVVIAAAVAIGVWSLGRATKNAKAVQARVAERVGTNQDAMGKGFTFVVLAGADRRQTAATTLIAEQASKTLALKGVQAAVVTLKRNDPEFEKLVNSVAVTEFPAVVLLGGTCGPSAVTGDITEDGLLKDYVRVTCTTGCDPTKSGCCPGQ